MVLAELGRHSLWAAWRRVKGWRGSAPWTHVRFYTPRDLAALLQEAGARELHTASAAYLPPAAPAWLRTRGASFERRARRLDSFGRLQPGAGRDRRRLSARYWAATATTR